MNTEKQFEKILTTEEAAGVMNCSVRLLKEMRAQGSGPAFIKLGRLVRYRLRDLYKYLDQNTVKTA